MKSDIVFKRAFNAALAALGRLAPGQPLPSEHALARELSVSRTTVRKVLAALEAKKVLRYDESGPHTTGIEAESFPDSETVPRGEQVERQFMEWLREDNVGPGSTINELELARRFGVATTSIREFLLGFQRFGLISKRPNSGWVFNGFTESFAVDLFDIRELFELRSARAFVASHPEALHWDYLAELIAEHEALLADIDTRFHDFSDLDSRFHRLINSAAPNRFIDDFFDIITMIFHYHYQWQKADERQRNEQAIIEHITYAKALLSRDSAEVERACRAHLGSARKTLLQSTVGRRA